jgi:hypothetical protein
MTSIPSENYKERIDALDNIVHHCIEVSQRFAGIPSSTGSHFYASVLFTSLCSRSVSLLILAPHTSWSEKFIEHWDYASIAGIVRSILEIRLAFFYLCTEKCSREEWECRWNLFNLHDCKSRIRLFEEITNENESDDIEGFKKQADELQSRLNLNKYFMNMSEKQIKKFLKGGDAYLFPLEEIGQRAGIDRQTFRWLYKLLSIHVHGLPMSFYRMGSQERGRGVHSEVEEGYTSLCLSFAISLLVAARDEMEKLFAEETSACI